MPSGNDFVAIAAGAWHNLALRADGSLAAWGSNYHGENSVPAGNDFVAFSAGLEFNLALTGGGSVVAWGRNDEGQIDLPGGSDFVAVAAGWYHGLALIPEPSTLSLLILGVAVVMRRRR